jgi:hypothetical protein
MSRCSAHGEHWRAQQRQEAHAHQRRRADHPDRRARRSTPAAHRALTHHAHAPTTCTHLLAQTRPPLSHGGEGCFFFCRTEGRFVEGHTRDNRRRGVLCPDLSREAPLGLQGAWRASEQGRRKGWGARWGRVEGRRARTGRRRAVRRNCLSLFRFGFDGQRGRLLGGPPLRKLCILHAPRPCGRGL